MAKTVYNLGDLMVSVIQLRVPDARMFTSDPPRGAVVSISVNWNSIAKQLAPKALRSKARRSRCMRGAVQVKVLEELGGEGS